MKAIALLSGGLDSEVAAKLVMEQGIEVLGLYMDNIFCSGLAKKPKITRARRIAAELGIPFEEMEVSKELLDVVKDPVHGYGSGVNPCIDCKILFFRKAKDYMEKKGARFIITGEVLGQRPMSQYRKALDIIERESGLEGLLLRPISAGLLPSTIPEREGWVDREKMLKHSGRSRKIQMMLAEKYGFKEYSKPAGGCLLADPGYSARMKESFSCEARREDSMRHVLLLQIGRHFRVEDKAKVIVGRNERENAFLLDFLREGDLIIEPVELPGPTVVIINSALYNPEEYLGQAIQIAEKYYNAGVELQYGRMRDTGIVWEPEKFITHGKGVDLPEGVVRV